MDQRGSEAFWRSHAVTPARQTHTDDVSRLRISIRDVIIIVVTCAAMYAAQIGAQLGMHSDIRDLKTTLENYQSQQINTNGMLQRQIDDWRAETKLVRVTEEDTRKELAELKGVLLGSGLKGISSK